MNIKIPIAEPEIGKEELHNVIEAVKSGWISSKGVFIEQFEKSFSNYIGMKYGVATSNGTVALHLALETLGIKKGDEVLVPTLTFIATANAVTYTGAKPIFVDSHPEYWCMDPSKIEEKITGKTKAIIVVHLYGHPCDMNEILRIADNHNLWIIEDCAEAHGAEYKNKKVGSFGVINCFSFFGNKIITTGEGGMCLTNDEELADKMSILRDHGMNPHKKYWHDVIGFNYRMTNLQAALGLAQLSKIDKIIKKKRAISHKYTSFFEDVENIITPPEMPWAKNIFWLYSILVRKKDRDEILLKMHERGIETRPLFYPIHTMPPYQDSELYPVAETLSKSGLSLPSSTKLKEEQIYKVAQNLIDLLKN